MPCPTSQIQFSSMTLCIHPLFRWLLAQMLFFSCSPDILPSAGPAFAPQSSSFLLKVVVGWWVGSLCSWKPLQLKLSQSWMNIRIIQRVLQARDALGYSPKFGFKWSKVGHRKQYFKNNPLASIERGRGVGRTMAGSHSWASELPGRGQR